MKPRIFSHFQDYLIQYISHQYQNFLHCNSSQCTDFLKFVFILLDIGPALQGSISQKVVGLRLIVSVIVSVISKLLIG